MKTEKAMSKAELTRARTVAKTIEALRAMGRLRPMVEIQAFKGESGDDARTRRQIESTRILDEMRLDEDITDGIRALTGDQLGEFECAARLILDGLAKRRKEEAAA